MNQLIEKIFKHIKYKVIQNSYKGDYSNIHYDSRKVEVNDIFIALEGSKLDGNHYIESAIKNGAKMIVTSKDINFPNSNINIIKIENPRKSLGTIASNFYDHPEKQLKVIGVTGTNGKTTTSYLLHTLLPNSAFIGSTGIIIGEKFYSPTNTTPESLDIIKYAKQAVENKIKYLILEVSSEGIDHFRIEGLKFDGAVFTNLSKEHLDHHKTMEQYFNVKERLFSQLKENGIAIISKEDKYGNKLIEKYPQSITYGFESGDYRGEIKNLSLNKMLARIKSLSIDIDIETTLIGEYNLLNILAATAIVDRFEKVDNNFLQKIKDLKYVKGRMQIFESKGVNIVIDYAHTEDALDNLLRTLKKCSHKKLLTLISGTGERYKEKRRGLGFISDKFSDYTMISSNSPRDEDPMSIAMEVASGFSNKISRNYDIEVIREAAVEKIISKATVGDIVVLTGKGHEEYQEIKGEKFYYSEETLVRNIINKNNIKELES